MAPRSGGHAARAPPAALRRADAKRRRADRLAGVLVSLLLPPRRRPPTGLPDDPQRAQRGFHTPLLVWHAHPGGSSPYPYNSALLLDGNGTIRGHFDKNILMVFGEYIPFYEQMGWLHKLIPETSNFARGTDVEVLPLERAGGTINLGPMICYEDIFPSFGRRLVDKDPNILINITNDAWFGRTSEPFEHMALSVYRTIEMRLDLVRVVNTGVSAFIDSTGRVIWKGPAVDPDESAAAALHQHRRGRGADAAEALRAPGRVVRRALSDHHRAARRSRPRDCGLADSLARGGAGRGRAERRAAHRRVAVGPPRLLALEILAHRHVHADAKLAFSTGLWLFPAAALGCVAAGIAASRVAGGAAPLEAAVAVLLVLAGPALTAGALEGEQAGLVISVMIGILVAQAAGRRSIFAEDSGSSRVRLRNTAHRESPPTSTIPVFCRCLQLARRSQQIFRAPRNRMRTRRHRRRSAQLRCVRPRLRAASRCGERSSELRARQLRVHLPAGSGALLVQPR